MNICIDYAQHIKVCRLITLSKIEMKIGIVNNKITVKIITAQVKDIH